MKRVIALIMSLLLIFTMSACGKSKEEKELERLRESQKQMEENAKAAQESIDDLNDTIERYKAYQSILDNYS